MTLVLIVGCIVSAVFTFGFFSSPVPEAPLTNVSGRQMMIKKALDGKLLAGQYCQSCHLLPEPEMLDKATWLAKVFPMMRTYMGMDPVAKRETLPHDLQAFYPTFPAMTEDEWFAVASYFIDSAPAVLPRPAHEPISPTLALFTVDTNTVHVQPPMTTMVMIDVKQHRLIIGDGSLNRLLITNEAGNLEQAIEMHGPPSSVAFGKDAWYVSDMGKLLPHDSAIGSVMKITWQGSTPTVTKVLDTLRRPSHVAVADMNADGREDLIVCEYGNLIGRFGWYEIPAGRKPRYHELIPRPGAIRSVIRDINADGKPDIIVQLAQARESIVAFMNKGKGRFEEQELLAFPPSYGSSGFRFVDADGDNFPDLLVTFGDNGDYDLPPYKPYHGVALYSNSRTTTFSRTWFVPMDGAYGADLRDFDGDGDNDLFVLAYFARFDDGPGATLRIYENQLGKWSASTTREAMLGRWMTYDVGDLDNDGDEDVVLGNVSLGPGIASEELTNSWVAAGRTFLVLRNHRSR